MKILHTVESYFPLKHGMAEVVRQLSERLAASGHEVTVATGFSEFRDSDFINGVKIQSFKIKGNCVGGFVGDVELYKNFLLSANFDVIVNFAAQQWATDLCIELLPNLSGKKVFVPTGFSGLTNPAYAGYFEKMKTWMNWYDMNVFLSDDYRDINFARKNGISKRILIPNGAAEDEFLMPVEGFNIRKWLKIPDHFKIILHVGSYTGLKGHEDAVSIFLKSESVNSALIFIGSNFTDGGGRYFAEKLHWFRNFNLLRRINKASIKALLLYLTELGNKQRRYIYTISLTRSQMIAAYQQADLFLFPSWIECSPIVLFEALASRTPFLVTDVGNAREIIEWTRGGQLLPTETDEHGYSHSDVASSAKLLSRILNDPERRKEMMESGFRSWSDNFTWEKITKQYENLYYDLLN